MVLYLQDADEGGFVATTPLDPELITEAETIEDAFRNAYDAAKALKQARKKYSRRARAVLRPRRFGSSTGDRGLRSTKATLHRSPF